MVDRRPFLPPLFQLGEPQMGIDCVQIRIGRNDVNMVPLESRCVAYLLNRKAHMRLQQLREVALMVGRKMNYHHEREAAVRRYVFEKYLEGG
jgi:hypothetical protein